MDISDRLQAVLDTMDRGLMSNDSVLMGRIKRAIQDNSMLDYADINKAAEGVFAVVAEADPKEPTAVEFEQALREGIVRNLLKLAEGRRVYKASCEVPPDGVKREDWKMPIHLVEMSRTLEIEACSYELAAEVVIKGEEVMYSLPSWMWSRAMVDRLYDPAKVEQ